jgi:hypothetical protein
MKQSTPSLRNKAYIAGSIIDLVVTNHKSGLITAEKSFLQAKHTKIHGNLYRSGLRNLNLQFTKWKFTHKSGTVTEIDNRKLYKNR